MEQLIQQHAQAKNLNRILGAENLLLDSERRREKKKRSRKRDHLRDMND